MNKSNFVQLSQLVDMSNPAAVLEEVKYNFIQHYPIQEFFRVRLAFRDFLDFYEGRYPGYKACNTQFHDRTHITDTLLAISRLIDGYNIKNPSAKLPLKNVVVSLIATIFHDSGYIQTCDDTSGTGAKYMSIHTKRSAAFVKKYFKEMGYLEKDATSACSMVNCTADTPDAAEIKGGNKTEKTLCRMLGAAEIIGQMASRNYLEKLIFLYNEFREASVKGYPTELSVLEKTFGFYSNVRNKLKKEFKSVDKFATEHFKKRYKIVSDMYTIAIEAQMNYLKKILKNKESYRSMLKRQVY